MSNDAIAEGDVPLPAARPPIPVTLADVLLRSREAWPQATALVLPDARYTYDDLARRAWATARSLAGMGVKPGDHVGLLFPNSVEFVTTLFGIAMLGAVAVPINTRYRAWELGFLVKDADLSCIVTYDGTRDYVDFATLLEEAFPELASQRQPGQLALDAAPLLRAVVMLGETERPWLTGPAAFAAAASACDNRQLTVWCEGVPIRSIAAIVYTSGTTSQPRGALLSQESLVRSWVMAGRRWGLRQSDSFWNPCQMFHIAGIGPLVFTLAHGAAIVTATHFEAGQALDQIDREKPTILYPTYPPLTMDLLTHPKFAATDTSHARAWLNVAPPDTLRRMQAAIPHAPLITLYGSTEGGCVTMLSPDEDLETRMTTGGLPLPGNQVRVVSAETGEPAPPGIIGEIQYRGYNALVGYYKDPEKTRATLGDDGWVRTGDVGDFDAAGRLTFRGRLKDMLKVGGENVAPAELEQYLESHPAVKLAQVFGIPDDRLVEVPVACIELHDGMVVGAEEIIAFCKGRISSFKVPRHVKVVTAWPMSLTKIQRGKLREQFIAEMDEARGA